MSDIAIKVENVSKKYCKSLKGSMMYGMADIGRNLIGLSSHSERLRTKEFWAVDNVSFELKRGETLGLIGPNGSGKTTMLKMLNGIFWPDKGKITVKGKVGALIAVGAGFHPLLTGRENIYINGAILGMSKREMDKKFDAIVDFADIGDFLDSPVKHYSSGMFVRLGFSVAVHCEPDILLVDEILAVGDTNFQSKCINRIKGLLGQGITVIFVSHNLNSVFLVCRNSIYIHKGKMINYGETRGIINEYKMSVLLDQENESIKDMRLREGTKDAIIKSVEFLDQNKVSKKIFARGSYFQIRIKFEAKKPIKDPRFVIDIFTEDGICLTKPHTKDHNIAVGTISGEGEATYTIKALPFNVGKYIVSAAIWESNEFVPYDKHYELYDFIVEDGLIDNRIQERFGLVYIPSEWNIRTNVHD